ncbi:DUF397 domain-containing protein [Streptomyces sp. DSM 44915]|uniref:DUF397 domain-containing protein n=1 Tax=Streptomyces chisholmiae TaxID=3075540 RepID=A0ABU2K0J8_9ACTN|nr:DUF397 domain-containing protein [Streptomyces sp. DSM 44915]MDT0270504.1 DUF397 domain-containing protein [Streptomyces sp. DSM 44915]
MTNRIIPNSTAVNGWRRSSHSNADAGNCLEVLDNHPAGVPVRDSKNPAGPALVVPAAAWGSFLVLVKG